MAHPGSKGRHWTERRRQAERDRRSLRRTRIPLAGWGRWGFLVCAVIAAGYGWWALHVSGSPVGTLDAIRAVEGVDRSAWTARLGPIPLEPGMNPLRTIVHESHAPVGPARLQFEVQLVDAAGRRLWGEQGLLGSGDDEASIVKTRTSLKTFVVRDPGDYFVRVRTSGSSMDDLRELKLEVRRNVTRVDRRITWGLGLAALAFLIAELMAPLVRARSERAIDKAPRGAT